MKIVYTGGFPELLTAKGHTIRRDEAIELPDDLAAALLAQQPEEFHLVD